MGSEHPRTRLARVEHSDDRVRLELANAPIASADFHPFWLRHQCPCCRHETTGERTLCPSRVPLDTRVLSARALEGGSVLELRFSSDGEAGGASGEHTSRFDVAWLVEHAYGADRPAEDSSLETRAFEVEASGDWAKRCLERAQEHGAALVRQLGDDTEVLVDELERLDLAVVPTHFGRIEDLRTDNTTNRNTDQLGYTDAAVDLHTDQPFLETPPRYQVLHCMRPAEEGGDSAVADGHRAALALRAEARDAFEILTATPVAFHRRQQSFDKRLEAPIIELRDGDVYRIRASYFTLAPLDLPFDQMEAWYRAYRRFVELIEDERHHVGFRLDAGDLLLYDNFRMLHARSKFRGSRWVRGIYFDPVQPGFAERGSRD